MMSEQSERLIRRSIENEPVGWVNNSTTEASFMDNRPQLAPEDLLAGSAIQEKLGNRLKRESEDSVTTTTTGKPSGDIVEEGDIMDLGPLTREALKESNFSTEKVQCLLDNGLNINAKDSDGCTMLNGASTMNNTESVEFLVKQKGVDPNIICDSSYYERP